MKLLFDQNLSPRLVRQLADIYPGSMHVMHASLGAAADQQVWEYGRLNAFVIVTKDADFSELSTVRGFPPKVIWLRVGNCTTAQIESLLRMHCEDVREMQEDDSVCVLSLV